MRKGRKVQSQKWEMRICLPKTWHRQIHYLPAKALAQAGSLLAIFFFTLIACANGGALKPLEYVKWVEDVDNGLKVTKQVGEYEYTLQYKPLEYVVLMEQKDDHIKQEQLNKRKAELEGMQYFTLKIRTNTSTDLLQTGIGSEEEYYARLEYFLSAVQDDMTLVEGNDSIPCSLCHFERNYGVAPYNNIVLGFPKTTTEQDKTFIFNDNGLGTGTVQLTIKAMDVKRVPGVIVN